MINILELQIKRHSKEELTEEELSYLEEFNARYALVKYLYLEKRREIEKANKEENKIVQFHFSVGKEFMSTPIFDVVAALLEVDEKTRRGEYKPLDFGDSRWNDAPSSGKTKRPYFLE